MKQHIRKTVAVSLSCLIVLSGIIIGFAAAKKVDGCNWMSVIDDQTSLADISMPGTHDTAATYVAFGIKSRCQDKTIPEQLNCGVRFLDVRLCKEDNRLKLVHNFINCRKGSGFGAPQLYFEDLISYCTDFLSNNTKECIVLFVKEDFGSAEDFDELLLKNIARNSDSWYTENRIPSLGEVRGKMVLMNRYSKGGVDEKTGGINLTNFPDQGENEGSYEVAALDSYSGKMISTFTVQDRFNYPKQDKWERAIAPTLKIDKVEGELLIHFFSTASGISPEINANYINDKALSYEFDQNKCYGAVLFDFVTPELSAKIYRCNASVINDSYACADGKPVGVPEAEHGSIRFLDFLWNWLIKLFA